MVFLRYYNIFGSGTLSGKMLLIRMLKIIKFMLNLGHVRFSKDYLCPAGLGKGFGYSTTG